MPKNTLLVSLGSGHKRGALMTPKRTLVVAVAVAVGVAASVLSYVFLNNAQQRAYHNAKLVEAYVVVKPVPATLDGSAAISDGYIAAQEDPPGVPPDVSRDQALDHRRASRPWPPLASDRSLSLRCSPVRPPHPAASRRPSPPATSAVTASVDPVHGVANFPEVGDKVDLMITLNGAETVLLQNVQIIAIGQNANSPTATGSTATTVPVNTSGLYTFSVSPTDAEKIALTEQEGLGLYMTLVPPNTPPASIPPVNLGNITSAL